MIDITGNWHEERAFSKHLIVSEPNLAPAEWRTFRQKLLLARGRYRLELEYDARLDREAGQALDHRLEDFRGLRIDADVAPIQFSGSRAATEFVIQRDGSDLELELSLRNTRPMRTWIIPAGEVAQSSTYRAVATDSGGQIVLAHGIPFFAKLDFVHLPARLEMPQRESIRRWSDGMEPNVGGVEVNVAHFLGMIHSIDLANGSWYNRKGDNRYSHFVGDEAGQILINWSDGRATPVPLIFGFNLWYGRPWDILWADEAFSDQIAGANCDAQLFGGNPADRNAIRDGVALADGIRLMGARSCNARYIFSLNLQGRAVRSFGILGTDELEGYPLISAITLETASTSAGLLPLPEIAAEQPNLNVVALNSIASGTYRASVDCIKHLIYTHVEEQPKLDRPIVPVGYFGPRFDFEGDAIALAAATYLYRNAPECASHCAEAGTGCESKTVGRNLFHYTLGMGVWRKNPPPFKSIENWLALYQQHAPGTLLSSVWPALCPNAWSRGAGELLRESMAFGYGKFLDAYVDWMDRCLLTEANPPHWNRVLGEPATCTTSRQVGGVVERGNRENDGHGICMWGRYMFWHWSGRPTDWNERHWRATEAAVEWIQWQLDNDESFPGKRQDVLYTESECAHSGYDIYSSYNCLHGLKLSIRSAQRLGRRDVAARWKILYARLRQGILDHLVDASPSGPIWHTEPNCEWQDHAHKLVPVQLATEGDTYTPLQDYAAGDDRERLFLEISRNSYRFLMREKNYDYLRMFGYGQGMMTQAALLLDEMDDADEFIKMMMTHCYLPRLGGWAAPEGIIVHRSGDYYLPVNGYLGQDSHLADSVKALRLMLGVDDNDPDHLRLVPRFPASWTRMSVSEFPCLTGNSRQNLRYEYTRCSREQSLEFSFERPVDRLSIRLGPLPREQTIKSVRLDGDEIPFAVSDSGDSRWAWVRDAKREGGLLILRLN